MHQQNPLVLNLRCRPTQVDPYNGHKRVVVVVVIEISYLRDHVTTDGRVMTLVSALA